MASAGRLQPNSFESGPSVTMVGWRKEKLDEFAKHYGNSTNANVDTVVFDVTDLKGVFQFASDMFNKHPDLDCVFLSSGLQRAVNWQNRRRSIAMPLTRRCFFLPYLQKQTPKETALIFTTSGLALVLLP